MNTLKLTDAQLYQLIDALDEARNEHETSYVEWCSAGNDPTDHIWYRMADASTMLDEVMEESDKASYIYDTSKPATFTLPRSLAVHTENRVRSLYVQAPTEADWVKWLDEVQA